MSEGADRTLGIASYEARWISRSIMVKLSATGVLPCFNFEAQLEQRPERVDPPNWEMIFYTQNFCLTATKPFSREVVFTNSSGSETVTVYDADGEHRIKIGEATPFASDIGEKSTADALFSAADLDLYIVYAKLPKLGDGHHGCIVVPADTAVTAIHYKAFGPASKSECENFTSANCSIQEPELVKAAHVIWPFSPQKKE